MEDNQDMQLQFASRLRDVVVPPMATLEILSRVFLFHFEKISGHFGLFRDVSVNTG